MSRVRRRRVFICVLFALALTGGGTATSAGAADNVITIRADSWCPMNCEPGSDRPGYMIEMAHAIAADAGYRVDYRILPWQRALRAVRKGRYDCVVGAYRTDAPDFVFPHNPWGIDRTALFVKAGNPWRYHGLASLAGQRVGIIGGYAYGGGLEEYARAHPTLFDVFNANKALETHLRSLMAGRITAVAESVYVMRHTLKIMRLQSSVKEAGRVGAPTPMYIACSPTSAQSRQLVRIFDEGVIRLRKSGRLAQILEHYGLRDWQRPPAAGSTSEPAPR
ncbi:MAG: transporter substrate-binding domain-containing protein [Ectothiorhodospiraceae bacterium]